MRPSVGQHRSRPMCLSAAWCTMAKSTEQICAAQAPWAYLWTAVGNALASSVVADALLSDAVPRRPAADRPTRILRVGLETQLLDEPANRGGDVDGPESRRDVAIDVGVHRPPG